jgi:D-ribulokinase
MSNDLQSGPVAGGNHFVIGVDVGTGSARAGVFDLQGHMLASAKQEITVFQAHGSVAEQSSTEIWRAVCLVVQDALALSKVKPAQVVGIGFDATCSLVVLGPGGASLPVGPSEDSNRDIILWMDHRAIEQAERINQGAHPVLRYVGGRISPEMETPKLLWLKEHKPQVYRDAWQFFDLTDFLTWRATGDLARSTCTVTCKWTYLAHEKRWDQSYFDSIGLGDLASNSFERIGQRVVEPGTKLGNGLTAQAAMELGLEPGTPVAAGVIDAHAGGIGTVGAGGSPQSCLAYVFGTSSCTMTTTLEPVFVPGVWGPYFSAMVPNTWLNEGGQSAAGAAIEHLLKLHPAAHEAQENAQGLNLSLPVYLSQIALKSVENPSDVVRLVEGLHVVPEFLGNRAPFADPNARAVIVGLGMQEDLESLALLYVAGICSIGYGLRQIVDAQAAVGATVNQVMISGGAGSHDFVRQILADTTGLPIVATLAKEPVLLGAAMLGSVAAGAYASVQAAMHAMSRVDRVYSPSSESNAAMHARRYSAFTRLQAVAREIR